MYLYFASVTTNVLVDFRIQWTQEEEQIERIHDRTVVVNQVMIPTVTLLLSQ
jgi:hypothetical protein